MAPGAKCWSRVVVRLRSFTAERQLVDQQIRGVAQRDQRAAIGDELLQGVQAGLAEAAAILLDDGLVVEAVEDGAGALVGEDDGVELLAQLAGLDVLVVERGVVELVLLEHPARPALVHRGVVGLVHADARRIERGGQ